MINSTPNRNLSRTTITIITIITNAMYISVFNTMLISMQKSLSQFHLLNRSYIGDLQSHIDI
jgi:hypothetical protein